LLAYLLVLVAATGIVAFSRSQLPGMFPTSKVLAAPPPEREQPALSHARMNGRIVVANRGSGTLTVIDARTDTAEAVSMPAGDKPPEPMYVVYSPVRHRVFVGDRANSRVVVFHASDMSVETTIPAGNGVFHMWAGQMWRQLWVVNDIDKAITVIDTRTLKVEVQFPLPADLVALGGRPHDIIVDPVAPFAYVTMLGFAGASDYVIQYDAHSFHEVARQQVGKDPHLTASSLRGSLYVPCQGSNRVYVLDRDTLVIESVIDVPGAHGAAVSTNGRTFYTTSFPSAGQDALFAIDTKTNMVEASSDAPFSTAHNILVAPNGQRLYVTHSGANNQVSVYSIRPNGGAPRLLKTVTAGHNPFGLDFVP